MGYQIRCRGDFEGAVLISKHYPEIYKSFEYNGRTLREVASFVKDDKFKDTDLKNRSIETIVTYLSIYFRGGEYKGQILEPKIEDYDILIKEKKRRKALESIAMNGYDRWSETEENFLIDGYNKGYSPKKIFRAYEAVIERKKFKMRSSESISSKLEALRKENRIGRQRIDWDQEIGFFALYLFEKYGKEGTFCKNNAKCLDDYFYDGKKFLTSSKLNNFYKRENLIK